MIWSFFCVAVLYVSESTGIVLKFAHITSFSSLNSLFSFYKRGVWGLASLINLLKVIATKKQS